MSENIVGINWKNDIDLKIEDLEGLNDGNYNSFKLLVSG